MQVIKKQIKRLNDLPDFLSCCEIPPEFRLEDMETEA